MKTARLVLGITAIVLGFFSLTAAFDSAVLAIAASLLLAGGIVGLCTRKKEKGGYIAAGLLFSSAIFYFIHSPEAFFDLYICSVLGGVFLVTSLDMGKRCSPTVISILWLVFFFPIGIAYIWSKTNWNLVVKILITASLGIALIFGVVSLSSLFPAAENQLQDPSSGPTSPTGDAEGNTTEGSSDITETTEGNESTEVTEPQVPEYIINTLTDELLFSYIDVVKVPEGEDGIWEFSGNLGHYDLTVTTEDGIVTSVVMDDQHILYQNGSVVLTIERYRADEFKKACQEIDYETLARNPDKYEDEHFKFTGEVVQVYEDGWYTILRINVTPYTIGNSVFYEDTIYAKVHLDSGDDRILEDDIITVWGSCSGLITYESIFGQQISIPGLDISYYEIVS